MIDEILQIEDLDVSFGGVHAVNHLSFSVHRGEILGLIGPNGSGKSTTVNLISGFNLPNGGRILLDGCDLHKKGIADRVYMGIGRTFQAPKPFLALTVYESVYICALLHNKNKRVAHEETERVLAMTGFAPLAHTLCDKLSVEKRKWLDMARLLPARPKVMLLDECLAGLNPSEMNESLELVQKINKSGVTIVFIEHVMAAVTKLCDRVVVLNEGSLLSEGIPAEVMRQEEVIRAYLGKGNHDA